MSNTASPAPTSRKTVFAAAASALLFLAAAGAEAQVPRTPRTIQPTPAPGTIQSGQADLIPVFDTSTVVRFMKTEQVRVSPDGRVEFKHVLSGSSHCSGLTPGASRQVRLPDFRYGVKNDVPKSVAGIPVADVQTPFQALFIGRPVYAEERTVSRIGPGETIMFTAPRREPTTIEVTLFQVPARVRPPAPTPVPNSGSTSVRVNTPRSPSEIANDMAQSKCVSNVFVQDPQIEVHADPDNKVKEANKTNNRKTF
jgi:hypothetical protein